MVSNNSIRVLVNTVSLSSGALTRERHLLRVLSKRAESDGHRYEVLCTPSMAAGLPETSRMELHEISEPEGTPRRLLWENTGLLREIEWNDPDLLYFPLHITNLVDRCPKVSAVRNAAPFYPEAHAGATRRQRLRLRILRAATRRTVATSERVVFMSRATRDRVAAHVPAAAEKGVVVPHGVPDGFGPTTPDPDVLERYALPESFLLSVSNVTRYKNMVELVDGYANAREKTDLPPLYLAGKVNDEDYARTVHRRIRARGVDDAVNLLGFVDHGDLPAIHAAADLFVFGSACENAPVSLVEGLACGDAIACSGIEPSREICGDAATYFDPYDPEDIGRTLAVLWDDPRERERLGEAALKRASTFSWERAATRTSKLFASVFRGEQA